MKPIATAEPGTINAFDFQARTRIIFGEHAIDRLGELAGRIGGNRVLVVTDPGIISAGHVQRGVDSLTAHGFDSLIFDGARENPTTEDVDSGLAVAKEFQPHLLIGLGGGSSMDCAKGINFVYTGGGTMHDYWGVGKAKNEMLPMIAVPTTAGTGSELQSFALISDAKTHVKMACGDKKASCHSAILDPLLTLTQPTIVKALTATDALSHAIETFVTTRKNQMSMMFSRESFRLIAENFDLVFSEPENLHARAGMQLGASYGGMAIENSMLGAAHALANPLTAKYGIAHGQAVGLMLPHVIRFNGVDCDDDYRELVNLLPTNDGYSGAASQRLAEFVTDRLQTAGLRTKLEDLNVDPDSVEELAAAAEKQWTANFNPRAVDASALNEIYRQAF